MGGVGVGDGTALAGRDGRRPDPTGLLNKYALPKVAMVVIAVAAAAGSLLSTKVVGNLGYLQAAARYLLLMGVGTAAGGLLWARNVVLPAARLVGGPESAAYAVRQVRLFHRIQEASYLAACVGWAVLAPTYWAVGGFGRPEERGMLLVSAALFLLWGGYLAWMRSRVAEASDQGGSLEQAFRGTAGAFVIVGLLLWGSGFLQVWHDGADQWIMLLWRGAPPVDVRGVVWRRGVERGHRRQSGAGESVASRGDHGQRPIGAVSAHRARGSAADFGNGAPAGLGVRGIHALGGGRPVRALRPLQVKPDRAPGGHLQHLSHVARLFTHRGNVRPG